MSTTVPVTVILPTHDHASTLEFSIRSILEQSFQNFELVVVGDGIGDDSRLIIRSFLSQDKRVRLIDKPKSIRHGELIRDLVIRESNSRYVAYHGDDDLMLPNHLETMLGEIGNSDFIHTLPIQVSVGGALNYLPIDISSQECLDWHLGEKIQNAVSLTGVLHSKQSYMNLPVGWSEAPIELPSDLYMWRKYFALAGFSGKTASLSTTIKLDASVRKGMPAIERTAEINEWWVKLHEPGFQKKWERMTNAAVQICTVQQLIVKERSDEENSRTLNQMKREHDLVINQMKREHDLVINQMKREHDLVVYQFTDSTIWKLTKPIRIFVQMLKKLF
jgi:glycosyltransferase involved in cell wall biosynthesis